MGHLELILGALSVILITALCSTLVNLAWRPYYITRRLRKQGVRGPDPKFWSGNLKEIKSMKMAARATVMDIGSHDVVPRVLPHYVKWMSQYGDVFFYRYGGQTRLCIANAEHVKQVLSDKFSFYPKVSPTPAFLALVGRGLAGTDGADWARHRRIVSPAFTTDKLKVMTKKMADCTLSMLHRLQAEWQQSAIDINKQFQELTADVIAHSAFGSSYKEGKEVFLAQKEVMRLVVANILNRAIPGYEYLPTKRNRKLWGLQRKIRSGLMGIIKSRLSSEHMGYGNDLLGLMMESNKNGDMGLNTDEIIEECKTFFFTGHETTSHLLTWTMFLLSTNQEWQQRLREEVVNECGMDVPGADNLSKFRLVNMVLLEALRLYTPIMLIIRQAAADMEWGGLTIPKGTVVTLPFILIHHKKDLWGDDVNEFNPMRFENGVSKAAKHPNAMLAFSAGPRVCIGQNFAMMEAKLVIALILQRFSFSLSPDYEHKPTDIVTLQPPSGLLILLKPL